MIGLEQQTNFPEVDLTDRNAVAMREILRQSQILHIARPENPNGRLDDRLLRFSLVPTITKTAQSHDTFHQLESILRNHGDSLDTAEWLDFAHGYTLDELIISLVAYDDFLSAGPPEVVALESLKQNIAGKSRGQYCTEIIERFQDEQPHVLRLIAETTINQRYQSNPSTLLGAAVKRQIELDGRSYAQSLVQ